MVGKDSCLTILVKSSKFSIGSEGDFMIGYVSGSDEVIFFSVFFFYFLDSFFFLVFSLWVFGSSEGYEVDV